MEDKMFDSDLYRSLSFDPNSPGFSPLYQAEADNTKTSPAKPTILVVDDERLIAETTGEILRRAGYDAFAAFDGSSGLQLAMRMNPDLILTDVIMPGMNGIDLAVTIRKALPQNHVILLSGQAGIADLLE